MDKETFIFVFYLFIVLLVDFMCTHIQFSKLLIMCYWTSARFVHLNKLLLLFIAYGPETAAGRKVFL